MSDSLYEWVSVLNPKRAGVFAGDQESLIDFLHETKQGSRIEIVNIGDEVTNSPIGYVRGSANSDGFEIHIEGCDDEDKENADPAGGKMKSKSKKAKTQVDSEGNVVEKKPRQPTEYNLYMKRELPILREACPQYTHVECFKEVAASWKEYKAHQEAQKNALK